MRIQSSVYRAPRDLRDDSTHCNFKPFPGIFAVTVFGRSNMNRFSLARSSPRKNQECSRRPRRLEQTLLHRSRKSAFLILTPQIAFDPDHWPSVEIGTCEFTPESFTFFRFNLDNRTGKKLMGRIWLRAFLLLTLTRADKPLDGYKNANTANRSTCSYRCGYFYHGPNGAIGSLCQFKH